MLVRPGSLKAYRKSAQNIPWETLGAFVDLVSKLTWQGDADGYHAGFTAVYFPKFPYDFFPLHLEPTV
jgi:hypothetical protein